MNGKFILYLIYVCNIILISQCKTVNDPDNFQDKNGDIIYFNSFEAESDTTGLEDYSSCFFHDDASPGGGKRSLYVSGGCIVPHVILPVPEQSEDGYFQLKCWAKVLVSGGILELSTVASSENSHIAVIILDKDWEYYQTSDSLYCSANTSMSISLISGGDNPGGMLVDQIQIVKTE